MIESPSEIQKKKHHYVPVTYLEGFTTEAKKLYVYPKYPPNEVRCQSPKKTGFRKYYYSQPLPEGGKNNNALEDFFSTVESKWSGFIKDIQNNKNVNDRLEFLLEFIALQYSRVPCTREAIELMLAHQVKGTSDVLNKAGKLPKPPKGYEHIFENLEISIDPHKSIHAMHEITTGLGELFSKLGFGVIRNNSNLPFITSDNPVIWFDSSKKKNEFLPYTITPQSPILFYFPLAKDIGLIGTYEAEEDFKKYGLLESPQPTKKTIKMLNSLVAKFSYEVFYSCKPTQRELLIKYKEMSPILDFQEIQDNEGKLLFFGRKFGPRIKPAKWENK
jgi:hypothetical protein